MKQHSKYYTFFHSIYNFKKNGEKYPQTCLRIPQKRWSKFVSLDESRWDLFHHGIFILWQYDKGILYCYAVSTFILIIMYWIKFRLKFHIWNNRAFLHLHTIHHYHFIITRKHEPIKTWFDHIRISLYCYFDPPYHQK